VLLIPLTATAQPQAPTAAPGDANEPAQRAAAFARRLWAVADLVLEKHIDPCTRQEMLLAGTRALLQAAGTTPPPDLAGRMSALTTREQFTTLLEDIWPKDGGGPADATTTLETAALAGLLKTIPGEAVLLSANEVKVNEQIAGNRYVGIGIQLRMNNEEKLPQIVDPFRRGAARQAGAKAGDVILQVDGQSTAGVTLRQVVEWLRGDEGTPVTIVVRQPGAKETRTLAMTRAVVPFDTVFGYLRTGEDNWRFRVEAAAPVGYVCVSSVSSSTLHELRQVERRLQAEGVRAVVLDFRGDGGGGKLHHAELLADGLLDGGLLWRLRERGQEGKEYRADRECLFRDWPLAVLVSEGMDSAEGAVIAALQDNGRAVLVGEPTRNPGLVRSLVELPDGQGTITLHTGRLERTAKGRGWPVQPDHVVPLTREQREAIASWLQQKGRSELPADTADRPPDDPQLAKAVELLREALKAKDLSEKP
jgi:carboxyl-terminal processing protease